MGIKDKLKRTSRIFINDSYAKDDSKNVTGHETKSTEEPQVNKTEEPLETGAVEQERSVGEGNEPVAEESVAQTDASEGQLPTQDVSAVPGTDFTDATEPAPATEPVSQSKEVSEPIISEAETNPEPVVAGSEAVPETAGPETNPQTQTAPQVAESVPEDTQAVPSVPAGEENTTKDSPLGLEEAVKDDADVTGAEDAKDTTRPDLASQGETAKADVQKASKNVNSEVKKDAFFKRFLGKFKKSSAAK